MASWNQRVVTNEHILPYVEADTAPEEVRASLNTLPFERNIFKASRHPLPHKTLTLSKGSSQLPLDFLQLLANAPNYFPAFMNLLGRCFSDQKVLTPAEWQVTVLTTSVVLNAPYEWDVNAPLAKLLPGWTEEKFEAIKRTDSSSSIFTVREGLIVRLIKDLATKDRANAQTMQRLLFKFTNEEVMEIFFVHGIYSFLARTMNSCEIDYDEPIPDLERLLTERFAADIQRESTIIAASSSASPTEQ